MNQTKVTPANISSGDAIIYEYGIRIDKEAAALAASQISMSRRLYNDIVACMRDTVVKLQAFVIERAGSEAQAIQDEIAALTEAFDAAKAEDDELAMKRIAEDRRAKWKAHVQ